jgi:hypothetical protein
MESLEGNLGPETLSRSIVFFINERDVACCPQVNISFGRDISACAILDTGSDANILTERVYDQLIEAGVTIPTSPLEGVVLITAFGKRTRRIKKQALLEFYIGEDKFESVFLISPQLINPAILGSSFTREYGITIDFVRKNFYYERE